MSGVAGQQGNSATGCHGCCFCGGRRGWRDTLRAGDEPVAPAAELAHVTAATGDNAAVDCFPARRALSLAIVLIISAIIIVIIIVTFCLLLN